jgi:hypothetical protein
MTIRIKNSLHDFIGKTISGIVTAEFTNGNPINRIFLTFSDGTALETWQDNEIIYMSHAPDFGTVDKAVEILERREGVKIQAFRSPHEDPNEPQRDLLTKSS